MVTIAVISPDSQTISPAFGGNFQFKVIPTVPPVGTPFDCTGFGIAATMQLLPSSGAVQQSSTISLTLSTISADNTGIVFECFSSDLSTLIAAGNGTQFNGYINALDVIGNKALVWAGIFTIRANAAQLKDL